MANSTNQTLIHHFLETSAARYLEKTALVHEDVRATYAEINARANNLAHYLIDHGISRGDRVVILLHNSLEYVVAYYGILKTGAVAVPLSTDLKPDGLKTLLDELTPKALVSSFRFERLLQATDVTTSGINQLVLSNPKQRWGSRDCSVCDLEDIVENKDVTNPALTLAESDLATIIYTSGSTGEPRGVMLSHGNIVSNTHAICDYLKLTEKDIQMAVLPFFYVMGKSLLNTHFSAGGTVVINNQFAFPAAVLNQMVEEHVTGFSGVPSTYAHLLHRSPLAKYKDKLDALRYVSQAGGHMPRSVKERLREVLPEHTDIYIMYGATEASARLTYLDPKKYHEKMDSIGKPIPDVSVYVVDSDGCEVEAGETGELVATGPNIMQGYWKRPDATDKVLTEIGYHTGDFGHRDAEGYLFVQGRNDDLLKVQGHKVNPLEIEDVLMASGICVEVAVLGISDDLLGNKLVTLVSTNGTAQTEDSLLKYCAQHLPEYKRPRKVKFIKSLPKKASGKINRQKCTDYFL